MKIRSAVLLLAVLLPAYFAATPRAVHIPPDLRDAVGGGEALNGLPDGGSAAAGKGETVTKIAAIEKYIP